MLDAVAALDWSNGHVDVFVKGEEDTASISPYWRRNCSDEAWREIKQQWPTEQDTDA